MPDAVLVLPAVGVELALRLGDLDALQQVPGQVLHLLEVVVPGAQGLELVLAAVEDGGDAAADVDLALDLEVVKGLAAEAGFAEGAGATGDGAGGGAVGEDAVDAGFAHFVVAFRVHEEAHRGVEVAGGFADGADVWVGGRGAFVGGCFENGRRGDSPSFSPGRRGAAPLRAGARDIVGE